MHRGCIRTLAIGSNDAGGVAGAAWVEAAESRTKTLARTSIVSSSRRTELFLQRQLPDPLSGGCEDGVGQRGSRDGGARLADPSGRFQVAHQVHLDRRR